MKRIQSEVKGRLEEDMVAMEEITAGERHDHPILLQSPLFRLFDDNLSAAVWLSRPQTDSSTHQPCAPGNDIGARRNETNGMDNVRWVEEIWGNKAGRLCRSTDQTTEKQKNLTRCRTVGLSIVIRP